MHQACHRLIHAPHRLMHACTTCFDPWCHRQMHSVMAWALLFWYCLGYTFISSYFGRRWSLRTQKPSLGFVMEFFHCIFRQQKKLFFVRVLGFLSAGHYINWPLQQLIISSMVHFNQLVIQSTHHFINSSFH
jgi:hypothetical protein